MVGKTGLIRAIVTNVLKKLNGQLTAKPNRYYCKQLFITMGVVNTNQKVVVT